MTPEQIEWTHLYWTLALSERWDDLITHIRANVNLSKEVLLSTDPAIQKEFHRGAFA